MANLQFPLSSSPGHLNGETGGRLVNVEAEQDGDVVVMRRVPGLAAFGSGTTPAAGCRGLLTVGGYIVGVFGTSVAKIDGAGTVTAFSGSLAGSDGVTIAMNNRAGGPDVVAVREGGGAYVLDVSANTVSAYPDADLPATVNSVCAHDGYFVFSCPDGRIFASDLNSTAVNALSFATAESRPDALRRVISHGGVVYALGAETIEPWRDVGSSPFPLSRDATVIPVGILTTMAAAGFEEGWTLPPFIVTSSGTVDMLAGFETKTVSTPAVERFIAASTASTIEAMVFTSRGRAYFGLSSDAGSWVLNVRTGHWHERVSVGATRWRAQRSAKFNGSWIVGDTLAAAVRLVNESYLTEVGAALDPVLTSARFRQFPARVAAPDLYADFSHGSSGTVSMRVSRDGGMTWSSARTRTLGAKRVQPWTRMGLATGEGLVAELTVTGGADFGFRGAAFTAEGRAP